MSAITVKNVVKRYGDDYLAIDDVSLDIKDGEFVILVGPSGCGKSTLLRMIVGLEDITDGEVQIGGQRVNELAPRDRNVSMVFQNYALYPHLTVFENIAFPLRLAKGKYTENEIKAKVDEVSTMLQLSEHLQRKPANLSGGQRQRVAMARAIVRDADAFLFDEPLSNLDAKLRGQTRTEISRLQRRLGITTVYVTHDQTEAMTLGDRVAVLKKGRLQQVASPRELYDNPVNLFVAGFIGSPPMNFVPASLEGNALKLPMFTLDDASSLIAPEVLERATKLDVLIAGVRPEHFEDAAVAKKQGRSGGVEFDADVDVTEWLGHELYAYIPLDIDDAVKATLEELDRDLDGEGLRTQLVASLDPSSAITRGSKARLWCDPSSIHLFDPTTGECLTRTSIKAAQPA
ncbi:voltage-dependent calcium channel gamma-6 subunit [Platysternon megacephalum]|uniref:Voltage-dependent calcium channel gamma-6 subunit n=1 Tax=Platysternon megacephalum TaxID=55544 RepID=A0A4D9DK11_9SAUR|nr:voltage-dependent calcium channel gamma-6 subunit [Platysternon megacephalum]